MIDKDNDGVYWFAFEEAEAAGEVGVRRDAYGLGLYVRQAPGDKPRRIASVDLFYGSPEGLTTLTNGQEPFVQLVIDDTVSDEIVATAKFLPDQTVIEAERDGDDFTFVSDFTQMPRRHLRLVIGRKPF